MKGSTTPRVHVPEPLPGNRNGFGCPCRCGLSPESSHGFKVINWAKRRGFKLHPWQRWLLVHALELNPDGSYRFRVVLVLVARQNGKTLVKMLLTLYRLYVQDVRLAVGTAQDVAQAREVMNEGLVPMMLGDDYFRKRFDPITLGWRERVGIWHKTSGDEYIRLDSKWIANRPAPGPKDPRYLIKALTRSTRGLWDCAELNIDELREQTDFAAWSAVSKIVMAAKNSQIWCMSNAGDRTSVVLSHLRSVALSGADPSMFIAEWSGALGCELDDESEWAQANPSLGRSLPIEALRSALLADPPNVFRTEVLCQFVDAMDSAVDMTAWGACADRSGSMDGLRPALVVDAANGGVHVTAITAAVTPDGRVRLAVVGRWGTMTQVRQALPDLVSLIKPKSLGWFPNGPGAALGAAMRKLGGVEIKGIAVSEACMTFADYVEGRRVLQPDDPMLDIHMSMTSKIGSRGAWMFDRGPEQTDAAWAAAGAVYFALDAPDVKPAGRRLILPDHVDA